MHTSEEPIRSKDVEKPKPKSEYVKRITLATKNVEFPKPIAMNLILEKDITPPKEEYNELKDLDETQNVSRLAKTYANTYVDAAENLNR